MLVDINEVAIATIYGRDYRFYYLLPTVTLYNVRTNSYITVLVLARVFVNSDTQKMYENLFRGLFPPKEEASGTSVRWQRIHGSGIEVVMCHKQASGKFLFLHNAK